MAAAQEQLQSLREIFEAVSVLSGSEREAALLRFTRHDASTRALLIRMLDGDAAEQPILDRPLAGSTPFFEGIGLRSGDCIGRYRIVREIAAGGMGSVYLAETTGLRREVFAVKVVRCYSADMSRRFQREQNILSRLEHPNIARLIECGLTLSGAPFLVMDYVEGVPMDEFCTGTALTIEGKLLLFRQLCAAVRYLHQNLVVHRDLKPANILVTSDGTVKLLDFGIARLLAPGEVSSAATGTLLAMTPDYASPEQVQGAPASTLTDVYSLGILFYELLTGLKPFAAAEVALHETLRRICEDEPARPSAAVRLDPSLARRLRGELDNIILKAIRKEPQRRYASVEQLDEDIRHYLEGRPVSAQGDSVWYRARKFATRNRTAVSAAAVLPAILCAGIVFTSAEARIAESERAKAEAQTQLALQQTGIADQRAKEAQTEREVAVHERANAERRLKELKKVTEGAVRAYSSGTPSALITQNARDSLFALQRESGLDPALAEILRATAADLHGYELGADPRWRVPQGWEAFSAARSEYRVGMDREFTHQGNYSLFIRALQSNPSQGVTVLQRFSARTFAGQRVRLSGYLRGLRLAAAYLWIQSVTAENASNSHGSITLAGTYDWRKEQVVVDVPADSSWVAIGIHMAGAGTVWADDFTIEAVSASVPLTERRRPENLSFAK